MLEMIVTVPVNCTIYTPCTFGKMYCVLKKKKRLTAFLVQDLEKDSHPSNDMDKNSSGYGCVSRIKQPVFISQLHSLVVWP